MKPEEVLVKKSKIPGKGVFAKRDIKEGEKVLDWIGCSQQLSKSQIEKLTKEKKKRVSKLKGDTYVLFKSPGRYINHSCDPNTKSINGKDNAIRNIMKGEEITTDYISEEVPDLNINCNCGSKNCIKIIRSENGT